jgi:hypothetical protein
VQPKEPVDQIDQGSHDRRLSEPDRKPTEGRLGPAHVRTPTGRIDDIAAIRPTPLHESPVTLRPRLTPSLLFTRLPSGARSHSDERELAAWTFGVSAQRAYGRLGTGRRRRPFLECRFHQHRRAAGTVNPVSDGRRDDRVEPPAGLALTISLMSKSTRNSGKTWTPAELHLLRHLARQNTPTRVAGLKLGRTPSAVQSKAGQLKVSLKPTNQSPYNRRSK